MKARVKEVEKIMKEGRKKERKKERAEERKEERKGKEGWGREEGCIWKSG